MSGPPHLDSVVGNHHGVTFIEGHGLLLDSRAGPHLLGLGRENTGTWGTIHRTENLLLARGGGPYERRPDATGCRSALPAAVPIKRIGPCSSHDSQCSVWARFRHTAYTILRYGTLRIPSADQATDQCGLRIGSTGGAGH